MLPRHGIESGSAWLEWIFPVLVIALLIAIVVLLVLTVRNQTRAANPGGDPVRRAALRLGAGEITLSEFDDIRGRVGGPAESGEESDAPD
jgi:hypothetical protein